MPGLKKSVLFPIAKFYCPMFISVTERALTPLNGHNNTFHDTDHQATRTVVPGRWDEPEDPTAAQFPAQIKMQAAGRGGGSWGPRRPRGLVFSGKRKEKEKATPRQGSPDASGPGLGRVVLSPSASGHHVRLGKQPPKGTGKSSPQDQPRRVPVPNQSEMENCIDTGKESASKGGQN